MEDMSPFEGLASGVEGSLLGLRHLIKIDLHVSARGEQRRILVDTEAKPAPSPQILSYSVPSPILPGVLGGHVLPPVVHPVAPSLSCSIIPSMCHQPVSLPMTYHPPPAIHAPRPPMLPVHLPMVLPSTYAAYVSSSSTSAACSPPYGPTSSTNTACSFPSVRSPPTSAARSSSHVLSSSTIAACSSPHVLSSSTSGACPPPYPSTLSINAPTNHASVTATRLFSAIRDSTGIPPSEFPSSDNIVYPTPEAFPPQGSFGYPSPPDTDPSKGDMSSILSMLSSLNGFGYSSFHVSPLMVLHLSVPITKTYFYSN
nr:pollen-specific leucine-rich repeat extensin-like protein 1 [Penaeus vannamei]